MFYTLIVKRNCAECGNPIVIKQHNIRNENRKESITTACPHCRDVQSYKPRYDLQSCADYGLSIYATGVVDDGAVLDCWLKKSFREGVFWAYNYEHLAYLKKYIEAEIRERKQNTGQTLLNSLPQFIKSAKNRSALIKIINHLEKK